jgi:hypothetical protein
MNYFRYKPEFGGSNGPMSGWSFHCVSWNHGFSGQLRWKPEIWGMAVQLAKHVQKHLQIPGIILWRMRECTVHYIWFMKWIISTFGKLLWPSDCFWQNCTECLTKTNIWEFESTFSAQNAAPSSKTWWFSCRKWRIPVSYGFMGNMMISWFLLDANPHEPMSWTNLGRFSLGTLPLKRMKHVVGQGGSRFTNNMPNMCIYI